MKIAKLSAKEGLKYIAPFERNYKGIRYYYFEYGPDNIKTDKAIIYLDPRDTSR